MDNSDVPFTLTEISRLPSNVLYKQEKTYFDSFLQASTLLRTEYSLIANDDDIYLPSGIVECVKFLDSNKEIISCVGQSLSFYLMFKHILFDFNYTELRNYMNLSENLIERIKVKANPYSTATFYAVQRSKNLAINLQTCIQKNEDLFGAIPAEIEELTFEFTTTVQGKSASIKNLMWLRSFRENQPLWQPPNGGLLSWLKSTAHANDLNRWIELHSSKLSKVINIEQKEISELFEQGLDFYSKDTSILKKYKRENSQVYILYTKIKSKVVRVIKRNTTLDKAQKIIMYYARYSFTLMNVSNYFYNKISEKYLRKKLKNDCIEVNMCDLQNISKFILNSNSKEFNF
jgi:glycosyltransferase domain-containing protein